MKTYIVLKAELLNHPGKWQTVLVEGGEYEANVNGNHENGNFANDDFFVPGECRNAQVVGTADVDSDDMDLEFLPSYFRS